MYTINKKSISKQYFYTTYLVLDILADVMNVLSSRHLCKKSVYVKFKVGIKDMM